MSLSLEGQNVLITGVSRPSGIGATLSKRFAHAGARLAIHGYSDYDVQMKYSDATQNSTYRLAESLSDEGVEVVALTSSDISKVGVAKQIVTEAGQKLGILDGLILNHAYSTFAPLGEWTEEHIDSHLLINVRASMLMIQAFAAQTNVSKGGTITLFTSGQYLGPMINEIAYAVSKDAIIELCKQASAALASKNILITMKNKLSVCIDFNTQTKTFGGNEMIRQGISTHLQRIVNLAGVK